MIGDRLIPAPQATSVGTLESLKLAGGTDYLGSIRGCSPRTVPLGKRDFSSSVARGIFRNIPSNSQTTGANKRTKVWRSPTDPAPCYNGGMSEKITTRRFLTSFAIGSGGIEPFNRPTHCSDATTRFFYAE